MLTIEKIKDKLKTRFNDGRGRAGVDSPTGFKCKYLTPSGNRCAVGCLLESVDTDIIALAEDAGISMLSTVEGAWSIAPDSHANTRALVRAMNIAGVPSTVEVKALLEIAQSEHDAPDNWHGTKYIGPEVWK
jgi:hypothetical protein